MAQLWGGRFTKETDQLVYNFNASITFDKRFYAPDIQGSIAHVTMLAKQGILKEEEKTQIIDGLNGILSDVEEGKLELLKSMIQKKLTKGKSVSEIAEALETDESTIEALIKEISK